MSRRPNKQVLVSANVAVWGFDFADVKNITDYYKLADPSKKALYHFEGKNLVVNAGADQIANLMCGVNTSSFTHCAVGSNSTAVTATDTALNTQLGSRNTVTNRYIVSTGVAHFDTFFASTDANGTWLETGLFTASAAGTMLARKIISSFVKATTNTAIVAWSVTMTPV